MRIHNHKLGNQILSLLMALVMVVSMLPMSSFTAFAVDTGTDTAADTTYPYAVVDTAAGTVTIDGTLGGKATATEDDITALVDAIKGYVDSGITTITVTGSEPALYNFYDVYTPAVSVAIFRLTEDSESSIGSGDPDSPYCGKIDLILQDVTEIVDYEFQDAYALNSITLPKVTTVGDNAFYHCWYLQELTFGSVVTLIKSEPAFSDVGRYVDGGLCNLVLSCGQVNAATEYQPDIETKTWWNTPWKHITVKHTPAENATYTDNGDGTHSFTCSICSNTITEYHSGGEATCTTLAICSGCGVSYGEVDSDNHTAEPAYSVNEFDSTQHDAYYSCCGTTVTEDHSGGTATCAHGKICEKCGSEYGEVDTTNHDSSVAFNEKGFCPNCGEYEPATDSDGDGYYEIGNAGQLMWFAELVNGGEKTANAILIDNIDMDSIDWTPICSTGLYYGSSYASGYGDADTGYAGIFDGNYHVIKNLSVTAIANETWTYGLFGTMTGTVKNLGIEGFTYNHNGATDMRTGAIVGQNLGGTIENCYVVKATITPGTNVAGGITGCNYEGTIKNCYVADSNVLASASSSTIRYGYIAGDNRADTAGDRVGTIENCYTDGDRLVGSYTGTETNSKYGVNYNYFTNGGVVWYLNGQSADGIWKQGETHPNFTGTAVTQSILSTYTQPEIKDGVYQIKTESELRWFAEYVNFTDASVSAVLANDIAMTGDNWIPIGMYGTPFTGTFDGQGYSITGFAMTITEGGRYGLFGEISGATVKNFSIDGEVTANLPSQQTFYYGVIGVSANSTITDVHSSVDLKVEDSFDKNCIAGIVASITTTTIERCSFSGTLDIGTAYIDCAGGIVGYAGWNNTHVIRDCAFYGKIVAKHESSDKTSSGQIGGILGYYRGSNITIESCLSVGTFDVANTTFTGMIGGRVLQMGADNISKVSNNYYYGNLPAFSDTEDSTHGYWSADMADYEGYGDTNAKSVTDTQLKSGEVTWLLNDGVADGTQVWYQTIGAHDVPGFEGATVNLNGTTYENTGNYIYVEITWTGMEFTYISGDWNPETHQYDEGYWKGDVVNNGEVTVTNKGSAVYVSYGYTSLVDGVSGSFTCDSLCLENGESYVNYLALEGRPTGESFTNQPIGSITVTIGQTPPASFTRWWEVGDTVEHIGKNGKAYSCYIVDERDGKYVLLTKEPEIFITKDAEELETLKETQLEAVGATRYPAFDSSKAEYVIYESYALESLSASNNYEQHISLAVNSAGEYVWLWKDGTYLVVIEQDISTYYENYDIVVCFYYIFEVPVS